MIDFSPPWLARKIVRKGIIAVLAVSIFLVACSSQPMSLEEQAQALEQTLMCPVCPSETIDQSQVPLAQQMRQRVRDMLAEGASRQEIYNYFETRYGEEVLAAPSKGGSSLIAWVVPPAGLFVGAVVLGLALRSMRKSPESVSGNDEDPEGNLAPYLVRVDSELGAQLGEDYEGDDTPGQPQASR